MFTSKPLPEKNDLLSDISIQFPKDPNQLLLFRIRQAGERIRKLSLLLGDDAVEERPSLIGE